MAKASESFLMEKKRGDGRGKAASLKIETGVQSPSLGGEEFDLFSSSDDVSESTMLQFVRNETVKAFVLFAVKITYDIN